MSVYLMGVYLIGMYLMDTPHIGDVVGVVAVWAVRVGGPESVPQSR
jgi:hypothetical protein